MGEPAHDDDALTVAPDGPKRPALAPGHVLLATLGWLVVVFVNLAATPTDAERIERMRAPALSAERAIERDLEIGAALVAQASEVARPELEPFVGDGPLGLPRDRIADRAALLLAAARDLHRTAQGLDRRASELEADDRQDARTATLERRDELRRGAARLAARAVVLAAAGGADTDGAEPLERLAQSDARTHVAPLEKDGEPSSPSALLAADLQLERDARALADELLARARARDAGEDDATIPASIDVPRQLAGLPELLVLEARRDLPPTREWAGTEAYERVTPALVVGGLLLPLALALFVLVVALRNRFLTPTLPLDARVPLAEGWGHFAIGQLGFFLFGALLVAAGIGGITGYSVALSSVPIALTALAAAGWRRGVRGSLEGAGRRLGLDGDWRSAALALAIGAAWVPAIWFGVLAVGFFGTGGPSIWANPYTDLLIDGGLSTWRTMVLEAGIAAPIFEELAFRGVLFAALRRRLSFAPAALASSLIFGLLHPYDLVGVLIITWVGFALAWLYERTGSLVACMAAHALYNLSSLTIMLLFI